MTIGTNAKQFFVGEWRVAPALDQITRDSQPIKLEPRLMRLLTLLASRPGDVITLDEILDSVWSGVVVTQSSVYNSVATLRKLLGDDGDEARYIATVSKRGYRLVAKVTRSSAENLAAYSTDNAGGNLVAEWPPGAAQEFDGFRVLRFIGEGSAGQVFVAQEPALERLIAVKLLQRTLLDDATARARFQREALAAARITHPNVTTIYRVGELSDGAPYIACEYIEGRNLADVLRLEGARSTTQSIHILASLADALAAADAKRIIHRDVKPSNILLENQGGRVVLTDFGIAGLHQSGRNVERLTHANELLGDPRYASPEQIRGEALTPATDIYSLGVVGYELLIGRGPYEASAVHELAQSHVSAEPLDLSTSRADVPRALAQLLKCCLAKKSTERPTAAEVTRQLRELNSVTSVSSEPTDASKFPVRIAVSYRWRVWAVGAASTAAAIFLLWLYWMNRGS